MAEKDNTQKLLDMKKQIEAAKTAADQEEGAIKQLKASLQKEFDVETLEDAEKLLERLRAEEEKLKTEEADLIAKLEADYKWN